MDLLVNGLTQRSAPRVPHRAFASSSLLCVLCSLSNLTHGPWSAALQPISIHAASAPTPHVRSQWGQCVYVASMCRHDHANPYCASVRMRFWISVPSCAHASLNFCAQLCACSLFKCAHAFFTSSGPHIVVCSSAGSVIVFPIASRKVAFEAPLLAVCSWTLGYLTSQRVKCAALISWTC